MSRTAKELEGQRDERRIVRVRIKLIDGYDGKKQIVTELENMLDQELFNRLDFEEFNAVKQDKGRSKLNFDKRHNKDLPDVDRVIPVGQRIAVDEYKGEPPYIHAGIHLSFDNRDEIEWFCDDKINLVIEAGPDPELFLVRENLRHDTPLTKEQLHNPIYNPFEAEYPQFCVNGAPVRSGPLRLADEVRRQHYFKFSVTVLGTEITLDPHVDGHPE
jgi:hypothetical protein